MADDLIISFSLLGSPKYRSLSEPYRSRLMDVFMIQKSSDGEAYPDDYVAASLGISAEEAATTKAAFVERGFCDSEWRPINGGPGHRTGNAARQKRHRERLKREREEAQSVTRNACPVTPRNAPVTQAVTPRNAPVTPPPIPPPNKSLTLKSNIQTDTHTSSARVCDDPVTEGVTDEGPNPPSSDSGDGAIRSACSFEEIRRLQDLVGAHFDPLCLSDVWGRHVRTWAVDYPADWIEAVLPIVAAKASGDKFLSEGWGRAILRRWTLAGGPPDEQRARQGHQDAAGGDAGGEPGRSDARGYRAAPATSQRPKTEHQENMARYAAMAWGGEEKHHGDGGERVGDPTHGPAREPAQFGRRA